MNSILLLGAGKSATVLIDYLINQSSINNWNLVIADANKEAILKKTNNSPNASAVIVDINNEEERHQLILMADVVISLMPPSLHFLIAKDCVLLKKHLLTASYIDDNIKTLEKEIEKTNLLFLCEMGLDPGIDHMSAMKLIDEIKEQGGTITSFKSHCGGLVAPDSDTNPWHYKISWNPRNVVMAGKAGALYKINGQICSEYYEELFKQNREVLIPTIGEIAYYPNRDSVSYIDTYQLHEADTFIRTTLRNKNFITGWKTIVDFKLTDEIVQYETAGKTLAAFYKEHFDEHGIGVAQLNELPQKTMKQLNYLGINDNETILNKGLCSAADVLQFALEKKLTLLPNDKDMIVMLHEIEYSTDDKQKTIKSSLVVKGENNLRTAMAKTVGLPLGIAAKFILNGIITERGLKIPVHKNIYMPVLTELGNYEIKFMEEHN